MDSFGFKPAPEKAGITVLALDYSKPPDEKLDVRSAAMIQRAKDFVCDSPEKYKTGDLVISECASLVKAIKGIHDPICDATNKAHKIATGARKKLIDPINEASKLLDAKLGNFKMAHDRKLLAEKRKLEAEAQKEQEEAALAQAVELEKDGAPPELVKQVLETAHEPVAAMVSEAPVLTSSNSRTADWDIEIVNKVLVPHRYLSVNEGAIRTAVRNAKGDIKITGVKVIETFKTRRKAL